MGFLRNFVGMLTATTTVGADSFQTVIDSITAQISWQNVVAVIGSIIAVCVVFVFGWWGLRKVISMLMSAFKKGRVSV